MAHGHRWPGHRHVIGLETADMTGIAPKNGRLADMIADEGLVADTSPDEGLSEDSAVPVRMKSSLRAGGCQSMIGVGVEHQWMLRETVEGRWVDKSHGVSTKQVDAHAIRSGMKEQNDPVVGHQQKQEEDDVSRSVGMILEVLRGEGTSPVRQQQGKNAADHKMMTTRQGRSVEHQMVGRNSLVKMQDHVPLRHTLRFETIRGSSLADTPQRCRMAVQSFLHVAADKHWSVRDLLGSEDTRRPPRRCRRRHFRFAVAVVVAGSSWWARGCTLWHGGCHGSIDTFRQNGNCLSGSRSTAHE